MAHISLQLSSQSETKEPEIQNNDDKFITSLDLDEMISEQSFEGFGLKQFVQAILVSLAAFFESQQSLISVYTDAEPTWHCINNKICNSSSPNICQLSKSSWAWDEISKATISEWGLECSSSFIRGLPAMSYFIGCLFGVTADCSLGRKNLLFLSCLTMSITTYLTIFSRNVWVYSLLRFFSGLGRASIGRCTIGQGLVDSFFLLAGTLSLPSVAFINPSYSWRNIYLLTSISVLVYTAILDLFVCDEEGLAQLKDVIKPISLNLGDSLKHETSRVSLFSSIKDLFQRRCSVQRTLALLMLSFGVGLVCYGMKLRIGNLGFDIYISIELSVLLYFTSFFISDFLIKRWNWKSTLLLLISPIVSRICSFMTAAVIGIKSERIKIGLELAYFLSVCIAYNRILIYVIESIPTFVSNSAPLMKRQAITFGLVFTSVLVAAGNDN